MIVDSNSDNQPLKIPIDEAVYAALRVASVIVPPLSVIAAGWNEYKNKNQFQFVQSLINHLSSELKLLEDQVDTDYLKTEDAICLIQRTVNKAKEESREEKRRLLASFLAMALTKELSSEIEKNVILDTIDKMSLLHCQILHRLKQLILRRYGEDLQKMEIEQFDKISLLYHNTPNLKYITESSAIKESKEITGVHSALIGLNHLCSLSLLEFRNFEVGYDIDDSNGGYATVRQYRLTALGFRTLDFLTNRALRSE